MYIVWKRTVTQRKAGHRGVTCFSIHCIRFDCLSCRGVWGGGLWRHNLSQGRRVLQRSRIVTVEGSTEITGLEASVSELPQQQLLRFLTSSTEEQSKLRTPDSSQGDKSGGIRVSPRTFIEMLHWPAVKTLLQPRHLLVRAALQAPHTYKFTV